MIIGRLGSVIVGQTWQPNGSLWVFDVKNRRATTIPVYPESILRLYAADDDRFVVVSQPKDFSRADLTVRTFNDPAEVRSTIRVDAIGRSTTEGDVAVWIGCPKFYLLMLRDGRRGQYVLGRIDAATGRLVTTNFDPSTLDVRAQDGLTDVCAAPGDNTVIVGMRGISELLLFDTVLRRPIGHLRLAGRGGRPTPKIRLGTDELWTTDFDAVVRIGLGSPETPSVLDFRASPDELAVLRDAKIIESRVTRVPLADFSFSADGGLCAVARPYHNDVVVIDCDSLNIVGTCRFSSTPVDAVCIESDLVIARMAPAGAHEVRHIDRGSSAG
jgi:hypothetical protein